MYTSKVGQLRKDVCLRLKEAAYRQKMLTYQYFRTKTTNYCKP